jgi:hypothetical protein
MPAPRGGKKPSERKPVRAGKKPSTRAGRPPARPFAVPSEPGVGPPRELRTFRGAAEPRMESTAGLRHELIDLRAEVHRLAAEIDKLWARERGRGAAAPGRTARSIAGKPVRTGTRAARPRGRGGAAAPRAKAGPKRSPGPQRSPGPKRSAGPKRSPGAKRGTGWAKPKSKSRRSGTTPRRRGR